MRSCGERGKSGPRGEEDGWHSRRLPNLLSSPAPLRRGSRLWGSGWAGACPAEPRRALRAAGKPRPGNWRGGAGPEVRGGPRGKGRGRLRVDRTEEVERPRRGRSPWKVGGARTAGRGHQEEGGAKACAASSPRDREVPREGAELWGPETPEEEEEEEQIEIEGGEIIHNKHAG